MTSAPSLRERLDRMHFLASGFARTTFNRLRRGRERHRCAMRSQARTIGQGLVAILLLSHSAQVCVAQPKSELAPPPPLSPEEGEREARTLLSNLLSQKPDQNATNAGALKIRDAERHERAVAVKFGGSNP